MTLHRALVIALLGFVSFGALLVLMLIWGVSFDPAIIYKLLATTGVLIVLAGLILVIKSDFAEHNRLKDQDFID